MFNTKLRSYVSPVRHVHRFRLRQPLHNAVPSSIKQSTHQLPLSPSATTSTLPFAKSCITITPMLGIVLREVTESYTFTLPLISTYSCIFWLTSNVNVTDVPSSGTKHHSFYRCSPRTIQEAGSERGHLHRRVAMRQGHYS